MKKSRSAALHVAITTLLIEKDNKELANLLGVHTRSIYRYKQIAREAIAQAKRFRE